MNSIGNLFIDYVPVVLPVVSILRVPVQGATSTKPSVAGSNTDDGFFTGTHRVREPATVKPGCKRFIDPFVFLPVVAGIVRRLLIGQESSHWAKF